MKNHKKMSTAVVLAFLVLLSACAARRPEPGEVKKAVKIHIERTEDLSIPDEASPLM